MVTNNRNGTSRPVKGSWEALLQEANALAIQEDDRAVAAYWRIIDRIAKMPEARRAPGTPLYDHLEEALFAAQSFLAKRGRFHDAHEFFSDQIEEVLAEDALIDWRLNQAKLLSWQEKMEPALTLLQAELATYPLEIPLRWLYFDLLLSLDRREEAAALVDDLAAIMQNQPNYGLEDSPEDEDPFALHRSLIYYLRSVLALDASDYAQAYSYFQQAAKISDAYAQGWHMLYRPLVLAGQFDLANRALNREESEASQRFWRGLNGYRNGDEVGSKVEWQQVTQINIENVWVKSAVDWVLAHFYLGDEDRIGLGLVLRLLNQPQAGREPLMLMLAALGWAIHGDEASLKMNLEFAVSRYRASFQDHQLPETYWAIAQDLLSPQSFEAVEAYFKRPRHLAE